MNPQMNPGGPIAQGPAVRDKVNLPATLMIVVAIIGALFNVGSLGLNVLGMGAGAMSGSEEQMAMNFMSGSIGIVFNIVGFIVAGLIIFAAMKMKNLESYGLALAGAILICVPFLSPCCLLGLPVGIWAVVVLLDDQVKQAFR